MLLLEMQARRATARQRPATWPRLPSAALPHTHTQTHTLRAFFTPKEPSSTPAAASSQIRGPRFSFMVRSASAAVIPAVGDAGYADVDLTSVPLEFWAPAVQLPAGSGPEYRPPPDVTAALNSKANSASSSPSAVGSTPPQWSRALACAVASAIAQRSLLAGCSARGLDHDTHARPERGASHHEACAPESSLSAYELLLQHTADPGSRRESAYTVHLRALMSHLALPQHTHLLTKHERELVTAFLRLSSAATGLLARMFQRKGPWFRTSSFHRYEEIVQGRTDDVPAFQRIKSMQPQELHAAAQDAVTALVASKLVIPLPKASHGARGRIDDAERFLLMEAISCLCNLGEIRGIMDYLHVRMPPSAAAAARAGPATPRDVGTPTPTGTGNAPGPTRDELLQRLRHAVETQRTVAGAPLPLARALRTVLTPSGARPEAGSRSTPVPSPVPSRGIVEGDQPMVRVHPRVVALLRRAHGLFYLATATAHLSSGMGTGSWQPALDMDAEAAALACDAIDAHAASSMPPHSTVPIVDLSLSPGRPTSTQVEPKPTLRNAWFVDDGDSSDDDALPPVPAVSSYTSRSTSADPAAHEAVDIVDLLSQSSVASDDSPVHMGPKASPAAAPTMAAAGARAAKQPVSDTRKSKPGRTWGPGSGSRYADPAAGMDTFLPVGVGAGSGAESVSRGSTAAYRHGGSGLNGIEAGMVGGGLFSPGLLQIFRRLSFARYACSPPPSMFLDRACMRVFEASHLFRAQADHTGVLGGDADGAEVAAEAGAVSRDRADETTESERPLRLGIAVLPFAGISTLKFAPSTPQIPQAERASGRPAPGEPLMLSGLALLAYAPLLVGMDLNAWLHAAEPSVRAVAAERSNTAAICALARATWSALWFAASNDFPQSNVAFRCSPDRAGAACLTVLLYHARRAIRELEHSADADTLLVAAALPTSWSQYRRNCSLVAECSLQCRAAFCASLSMFLAEMVSRTKARGLAGVPLETHPFLHQLTAASVLATLLWESVDPLERARCYVLTVPLLTQLVLSPFTPHRSGRWWGRLVLNLSHVGLLYDAYDAACEALRSPHVRAGDRLDVYLRCSRLRRKLRAMGVLAQKQSGRPGASPAVGEPQASVSIVRPMARLSDASLPDGAGKSAAASPPVELTSPQPDAEENDAAMQSLLTDALASQPSADADAVSEQCNQHIRGGVSQVVVTDTDIPALARIQQANARATGVALRSRALRVDSFVRAPLNKETGERSRFVSGVDAENDGEAAPRRRSIPLDGKVDLTDDICRVIGITWPSCPGTIRFERRSAADAGGVEADASTTAPAVSAAPSTISKTAESAIAPADDSVPAEVQPVASSATPAPRKLVRNVTTASAGGDDATPGAQLHVTVEQLSLQEYFFSWGGWRGLHCEGGPLHAIFGLLMWDIIFIDIPGVFITPYQDGPLDLDTPMLFYTARAAAIESLVLDMVSWDSATIMTKLRDAWQAHHGTLCRGLRWDAYPLALLQLVAAGLGGPALAVLCDALCWDHKHLSGGLPDLLIWRVRAPADCALAVDETAGARTDLAGIIPPGGEIEVAFVEVKGPRDRLSEKQHVWLRVLLAAGIDARVCKITEQTAAQRSAGSRRRRSQASTCHAGSVQQADSGGRRTALEIDDEPIVVDPYDQPAADGVSSAADRAYVASSVSIRLRVVGDADSLSEDDAASVEF